VDNFFGQGRDHLNRLGRTFGRTDAAVGALLGIDDSNAPRPDINDMHGIDRAVLFANFALDAGDRTVGFGLFPFLRIDAADRDQMRSTDQFKDVLRTFDHTFVTAGAEVIIDDRQTIGSHLDGTKGTNAGTRALHHTAEVAGFRPEEIGQR
jgi:hypothetical protein